LQLYFENITLETVADIYALESSAGVIVAMGGQTPNNIALGLHHQRVKILGTSPDMIDMAENRYKFSRLLDSLGVDQPSWKELNSYEESEKFCDQVLFFFTSFSFFFFASFFFLQGLPVVDLGLFPDIGWLPGARAPVLRAFWSRNERGSLTRGPFQLS